VWRSVRAHGETKTERSRRTLGLPAAVQALRTLRESQGGERLAAGDGWTPRELRTTFVSLLSHQGVAIEVIARLAGHASTRTKPAADLWTPIRLATAHRDHPPATTRPDRW
jgi:integrase